MIARALVARWSEHPSVGVDAAFRLLSGEGFGGFEGFGEFDGRVDLRGFKLPSPDVVGEISVAGHDFTLLEGVIEVRGGRWSGLDLSGSVLPSLRFFDARIEDCVFDGAKLLDWRLWRSTVVASRFDGVDLRESALGTDGNVWRTVSFRRANFGGVVFDGATLEDCTFDDAKFSGLWFNGCRLKDVTFAGRVHDLMFDNRPVGGRVDPGPMVNVSFENATLSHVDFLGCRLSQVRFPDDAAIHVFPHALQVYQRALKILKDASSPHTDSARRYFEDLVYSTPGLEGADGYFNRADWTAGNGSAEFREEILLSAIDDVQRSGPEKAGRLGASWVANKLRGIGRASS